MSLADELLADLEDVDENEEEPQDNGQQLHQNNAVKNEDSDTEMANGEEEVAGLVLEGELCTKSSRSTGHYFVTRWNQARR